MARKLVFLEGTTIPAPPVLVPQAIATGRRISATPIGTPSAAYEFRKKTSQSAPASPPLKAVPVRPMVFWLVNGIQTWPGSPRNWNKRGCIWLARHFPEAPVKALADEYWTTALTVWLFRKRRARAFANALGQFGAMRNIIVAHSNGATVALDALRALRWTVPVEALHLVSGACDSDCERTTLNSGLRSGALKKLAVYLAGRDRAMRLEETLAGRSLFGLGSDPPMGAVGPKKLDPLCLDKVTVIKQPFYGHSTWWLPDHFNRTMRCFLPGDIS